MKKLFSTILLFAAVIAFAQVAYTFTVQTGDFKITTDQTYKVVTSAQTGNFTTQVGAPRLPVYTRSFVLPSGSTVTNINISNQGQVLLDGNADIYPAQPPQDWVSEPAFVSPDLAVYNSANPYPANTVVKTGDGSAQGYHIVTLDICPFKYIPNQKKLYLYQTINITIQYTIGNVEKTEKITRFRYDLNREWVASQVENPVLLNSIPPTAKTILDEIVETDKSMLRWKPSAYNSYIPDYIIITNEALKSKFEQLADYKTKRGFTTLVVTTEQIYPAFPGMDNAEKIRNYLKAVHKYWGAGMFVLLGGDTEIIPGRIGTYMYGPDPTDLYYSDVFKPNMPSDYNYNWNQNGNAKFGEGNDGLESGLMGDNYIGRAPVDTQQEAQNFINKIVKYEKLDGVPPNQRNYVNNMLFLGSYYEYPPDPVIYDENGNITNNGDADGQEWHTKLKNEPFLSSSILKKWLLFDDHQTVPNYQPFIGNEELNKQNTLARMNTGKSDIGMFHLVSHYDHGGAFGIGVSGGMKHNSLYREDMDNLTNGNFLQIMYTTACKPGTFTLDALAEHYINNPNGGGVAILANSATVWNGMYNQDKKLFQSIYAQGNDILSPDAYLMGVASANARYGVNEVHHIKVLTLFGDPTMMTWSATPGAINLSAPTSIAISNSSDNALTVSVGDLSEEAMVTLYKYNVVNDYPEVLASQEVPAHTVSTVFHLNPDTPGTLLVTATAKNYIPPIPKNVNILMPEPHLYIIDYSFEDENENHLIEPGENITLNVVLKNSGGNDIESINAVLSNESDLVTITHATATHNPIVAPGQNVTLNGFTFTPLVEMGVDEIPDFIEFHLDIAASGNYSHLDNFYLEMHSAVLNLGARILTDNAGNPVPPFELDETVNAKIIVSNTGNVSTGALTAVLSSELTSVTIDVANGNYDAIAVSSQEENILPFEFRLTESHTGAMPFTLTLSNDFGQSWEFNFDMSETCPTAISGFDFTSATDRINLMWTPISGIGGYNIYRSDTENGNFTKINDFLIVGTAAYTDYEVEEATEYYYKISAVSLSGQECPLDGLVSYLAWTSLELYSGFPVANTVGRLSAGSPMLYDVDGDGYKEIFLNFKKGSESEGAIFGFRHDGQEIFNIDGNETTVSGFAITDFSMLPNSAVGDLDKDGFAEVISAGRNNDTNHGGLYVFKTIDEDEQGSPGHGQPDPFWDTEYIGLNNGQMMRNPVLYDLDNDGFLEIIVLDEHQKLYVYDKDKNLRWSAHVGNGGWSEGEIAVADLDNDGFGEIAFGVKKTGNGTKGGIYIFNYDGTPYSTNPFHEFDEGERADGGLTIANIDTDEDLEILLITKKNNQGKIHAFKLDGNYVNSNWSNYPQFQLPTGQNTEHIIPRISVGDINNDGNLEVVFGSKNHLYALDKEGVNLSGFPLENIGDIQDSSPLLADIDGVLDGNGNSDIEIITNVGGVIKAFKNNGTECVGWGLQSDNGSPFRGSPAIADIDNDGLNEIVISSEDCTAYVWETNGSFDKIEWGSHRADSYNTGTYKHGCRDEIDLFIKDGPTDQGIEPNVFTEHMWNSRDIWIRNINDNGLEHQNPEYKSNNEPNYIMIRVINKGCKASTGTETLTVNWAKANTNLAYPQNWDGTLENDSHFPLGGQVIGTPVTIPVIQPGEETIITIPWVVPNPSNYTSGPGNGDPQHFCLLATILGVSDPLTHSYTENPNIMVRENNNQAWRNLTIVDLVPGKPIGGTVAVSNHTSSLKSFDLNLTPDSHESGTPIFEEAEVTAVMDSILYNAWVAGGSQLSKDISVASHSEGTQPIFYVSGYDAQIKNLILNKNETGYIALRFNVLTRKMTSKPVYSYHLIQIDNTINEIMGGESYEIRKPPRLPFYAEADNVMADRNETVTLTAEDINEEAVYNWYDMEGDLIYTGAELTVIADIAKTYKLEIIADADGYKDYTDVNVDLNPHTLKSIVPNPAGQSVLVSYNLNAPDSAYISVLGYIGNDTGVERNYILDTESTQHSIDLSGYAIGFYTVKLICDGQLVGTLNLIKE